MSYEMVVFFDSPERQPPQLALVCADYAEKLEKGEEDRYALCREFQMAVESIGFTFDYGLDGVPFELNFLLSHLQFYLL